MAFQPPSDTAPLPIKSAKPLKMLGHAQMCTGVLLMIIGSAEIVLDTAIYSTYDGYTFIAASIWGGLMLAISGILSRATADKPHKCHIIGSLSLCIFVILTSIGNLTIESICLESDQYGNVYAWDCGDNPNNYYCNRYVVYGPLTGLTILHSAAVILVTVGFGCVIAQLVYISKELHQKASRESRNEQIFVNTAATEMPHNYQQMPLPLSQPPILSNLYSNPSIQPQNLLQQKQLQLLQTQNQIELLKLQQAQIFQPHSTSIPDAAHVPDKESVAVTDTPQSQRRYVNLSYNSIKHEEQKVEQEEKDERF